ncbi:hypothetical protein AALO_G00101240 [Alosa alosa]|uniref:RNase H type-1 domain-containing protein n=1 Tax=Alosa alosa TaxID=278164 RepID=A0AAV6GU37_9TELE|nr:hypothetical protein AALO_G00101240 [Alosa alosa]
MVAPTVAISPVPPWFFPQPAVDMAMLQLVHEEAEVESLSGYVQSYIRDTYHSFRDIYTDGSKDPESGRAGASIVVRGVGVGSFWRLTDEVSVYSTEIIAIAKALEWVEEARPERVVICSDSASVLSSLQSFRSCRMDILYEVYMYLYQLERLGITIKFLWIPAHVGVWGNERADTLAKKALERPEPEITLHLGRGEMKVLVQRAMVKQWQVIWQRENKGRHLYNIQRKVGREVKVGGNRRDEVVMARMRIGHTLLNSTQFRTGRRASGKCTWCSCEDETIQHVLFECPKYHSERIQWKTELQRVGCTEFNQTTVLGMEGDIRKLTLS